MTSKRLVSFIAKAIPAIPPASKRSFIRFPFSFSLSPIKRVVILIISTARSQESSFMSFACWKTIIGRDAKSVIKIRGKDNFHFVPLQLTSCIKYFVAPHIAVKPRRDAKAFR